MHYDSYGSTVIARSCDYMERETDSIGIEFGVMVTENASVHPTVENALLVSLYQHIGANQ